MRPLSATEMARLQAPQNDAMLDTARRLVRTAGAQDAHGAQAITYVAASTTIACGYRPGAGAANPSQRDHQDLARVPEGLAIFRLPVGTTIDGKDRIRLEKRMGRILDEPIDFEIVGEPTPGVAAILIQARSVTDGS